MLPIIGLWRRRRFATTLSLSRNEAKTQKDRRLISFRPDGYSIF
jgi:hypothetical protein